ncbi:MAG: hypothetical protein K2M49_01325 [Muribaculaceae bacterium]|nr:hypothetical protein [Muribaculaceae bacterium]
MKKVLLIACGLMMAGSAFAQQNVLKDAERALRVEVPDHAKIASMLEGAMTNPETAEDVKTWYLAGKNAFQTWQTGWEQLQQGGNPDKVKMSKAIVDGYDFYVKAFGMDTVRTLDKKGVEKIKTKYSKEMVKTIVANMDRFYDAGALLYEGQDLPRAYRAWEIYTSMPTMPSLGKDAPAAPHDSIMGQTYYNMGIFAYQADMKPEALKSFVNAIEHGWGEAAYDNALALAAELEDMPMMERIANEGFNKFGKQNYIGTLVSLYVKKGDYDTALQMVNRALAQNPDNAVLYNVKGVLVESTAQEEGLAPEKVAAANEEALGYYGKAVELDANNPEARFNYGRMLANKAYKASDDGIELSNEDYNKLQEEVIVPYFKQAAEQLEACIAINPETNRQAFTILKNIYYNLKDDVNMQRIADLELE